MFPVYFIILLLYFTLSQHTHILLSAILFKGVNFYLYMYIYVAYDDVLLVIIRTHHFQNDDVAAVYSENNNTIQEGTCLNSRNNGKDEEKFIYNSRKNEDEVTQCLVLERKQLMRMKNNP